MKPLRILLADDHSLILKGVIGLLQPSYHVVGAAENGKALVAEALRLHPDVIVLDVSMPILNGIEAAREIRKTLPSTRFVFLTMHSNAIYLRKALEAGASAYVLKSGAAEELLTAIEHARLGKTYITPNFDQNVLESVREGTSSRAPVELTERQTQILQLIAEGRQTKEIAELLHVSTKTVEFHRSRLMAKIGAHSVAELTRFAVQEGIVGDPAVRTREN